MEEMSFEDKLNGLKGEHDALLVRKNQKQSNYNGIFQRYSNPVLTAEHIPLQWRYDLNENTNPFGMERIGVNAVFNAGAIKFNDRYILVARVEGWDRKSYFAIAESPNGIDDFRFWEKPLQLPQTEEADVNVYDMRLTQHQDGWIYGLFCTERKDPMAPDNDTAAAVAKAGIVRTKDLMTWERMPDLITSSVQQRNVVLHPQFVDGKYALYTRPQDGFIEVGGQGGISLALVDSMENAVVYKEKLINPRKYHTVYELKNGLGPAPLRTSEGWLHLAHGVRNTAGGLRYVLYLFMTSLDDISKIIYCPAGYLMAPMGEERIGDVPNVLFSNGWIQDKDGTVFIYYASSDTRLHVATTTIDRLLDYVKNTPADDYYSNKSVEKVLKLIERNQCLEDLLKGV